MKGRYVYTAKGPSKNTPHPPKKGNANTKSPASTEINVGTRSLHMILKTGTRLATKPAPAMRTVEGIFQRLMDDKIGNHVLSAEQINMAKNEIDYLLSREWTAYDIVEYMRWAPYFDSITPPAEALERMKRARQHIEYGTTRRKY
jgi:hypothetical protein